MYLQKGISIKTWRKTIIFCWHLQGHWQKDQDPLMDPDSLVTRTDPRIRICIQIRTKMTRILNTGFNISCLILIITPPVWFGCFIGADGPYRGRGIYPVASLMNHCCVCNTRNIITGTRYNTRNIITGTRYNTRNIITGTRYNTRNIIAGSRCNTWSWSQGPGVAPGT